MSWKKKKQIKLLRPLNPQREDAETWKALEYNPASIPRQGQEGVTGPSQAGDAERPDGVDTDSQITAQPTANTVH